MIKYFNKKSLIKLLIIILVIIISLLALIPINKNYQVDSWMGKINDDTLIENLTIPGSHDSGALHSFFDVAGKCQDLSIAEQLRIGVRFLDIRLRLVNDSLYVVHSFVDQRLSFYDVLEDINHFINEYNSEFLIISIKEDNSPKNSNLDFSEKVLADLKEYEHIVFEDLPTTLKEARGKVYILNRFTSKDIGIKANDGWLDSTTFTINDLYIQDNYCVTSSNEKINDIQNTFESSLINNKLTLNFTSGYLEKAFPPMYSATLAKDVNQWLDGYLDENRVKGIVIMDFVTSKLVRKVYMENDYEENR